MKLVILKNNLVEALTVVERAVGSNTNLPILKNVFIKANGNKISLTTTNLEFAVTHSISGKIIETGETTVPFVIFSNVIKNLTSERVTFEKKERKILVTTDNYEAVMEAQDAREFPIIPSLKTANDYIAIKSSVLTEIIGNVVIATQYSDIRPEISGVYFEWNGDQLVCVATDSFRLAERVVEKTLFDAKTDPLSVIIPLRTTEEMLRIFSGRDEEELKVYFEQNQIFIVGNSTFVTSRLIDGKFPDYRAVLPKETNQQIEVKRQELLNAVKLTSSFSGRTNDITIQLGDNKKFLEIYSASSTVGENRYRIPVKAKGEKVSIVFNWRYLLDGLKVFGGEKVMFGITSADRAVSIKSETEPFLAYILMPIKM